MRFANNTKSYQNSCNTYIPPTNEIILINIKTKRLKNRYIFLNSVETNCIFVDKYLVENMFDI